MTPEMGPSRRQQSSEDRIRALMQGLGGEAAGAAGDFIQKMPFRPSDLPAGPLLQQMPYRPSEQKPGPYIQKMPLKLANPHMHKTVPRDIRID